MARKVVLVKFIKMARHDPYWLSYGIGDIAEIEEAIAMDLIDQGIVKQTQYVSGHAKAEKAVPKQDKIEKR